MNIPKLFSSMDDDEIKKMAACIARRNRSKGIACSCRAIPSAPIPLHVDGPTLIEMAKRVRNSSDFAALFRAMNISQTAFARHVDRCSGAISLWIHQERNFSEATINVIVAGVKSVVASRNHRH